VRFVPGFSLTGLDGKSIQKDWAQEPNCYLGIAAPHFPNYFIVLGPRGPWGNGPLLASLETMCDHFVEVMRKMQKERIKSLEVKLEPTIRFNQYVSSWHRGTGPHLLGVGWFGMEAASPGTKGEAGMTRFGFGLVG
jgi:cation diffusion facilitator CzcD-associated flavoprotein CzcO